MIYEIIKSIYPDIPDSAFSLQDDGDGPYIAKWTYDQPQPTQEQLDAGIVVNHAALISAAHARINTAYESAVKALTAGYPDTEIASWPKQEAEARKWLVDNAASTPWIDNAASSRGIPKAQFINLVIANADALAPIHGQLSGKRQSLRDQIDALGPNPTQEQLDYIQWQPQG